MDSNHQRFFVTVLRTAAVTIGLPTLILWFHRGLIIRALSVGKCPSEKDFPVFTGSQRLGLEPRTSSLTWIRVKIAGFVSSRQSFFFLRALSYWAISVKGGTSGFEPETSSSPCALKLLSMTHQVIFFAFSCALPTELCPPIRSVGLEPTCHVTEVFETSLYTYSSMTACGIGLIRSVPVCVKNSGNNTSSHFIHRFLPSTTPETYSVFFFHQPVPVKVVWGHD